MPLAWLAVAAKFPGRAFQVGVLLWYRARLTTDTAVRLPRGLLESFGIDKDAKARALHALEGAGLITVERRAGKTPRITLITRSPQDTSCGTTERRCSR